MKRYKCKNHKRLCIVLEPAKTIKKEDGSLKKIPQKEIRFVGGYFDAKTKEEIAVIEKYKSVYGIEEVKLGKASEDKK